MKAYKCPSCGDVLTRKRAKEHKIHTGGMLFCRCRRLGLDWMYGTDLYRIVGEKIDVE